MSRIGKKLIKIPAGVTVGFESDVVTVKGPKAELKQAIRPEIEVLINGDELRFNEKIVTKASNAFWGLTRALIANMILGVTEGFQKKLILTGVGYRVKKESDKQISLTLGFSHPVVFDAPEGITFDVEGNDVIFVKGSDKNIVGLTAAKIRKLKKPEPYKGKGIKYDKEVIRRKAGKAGKA